MEPAEAKTSILVVEDDILMSEGIADILRIEGYQVETAPNGRAALVKMQASTPDLVLSDIMMPEMDGLEFCALVRANSDWRTLPFIFLTALGQKINHRRGLELGADDYLVKPFEADDLLIAVRARIRRAADHRAATDAALSDLRSSILTMLNHEFRTPLTYITGYSRLLAEGGREMNETSFQSCVHALLVGADRLRRLVENVLMVTQLESGELAAMVKLFPGQTTDLSALVRTLVKKHQPEAEARRVVLHHHIPVGLPPLSVSREYTAQVIDHLLDNAIKFAKREGGQVTLSAAEQEPYVELTVSDDGIGIRPDALAWAFDSFRQIDRDKQEQRGAGLGLTIVRGLVQTHGGHIDLESELGVGTTVRLQLPVI